MVRQAIRRSGGRAPEETVEVSLCETLPASESIVAALANVADPTVDISAQELSVAAPRVANDAQADAVAVPHAAGEPSRSTPARAPRSVRWWWVAGALSLLLAGAFFWFAFLPLVGPATKHPPAPGAERSAADGHTKISQRAAASDEIEVASAHDKEASVALPAAQPSMSATGQTSADRVAKAVEADERVELDAPSRAALTRADSLAAQGDTLRKRRKLGPARAKYRAALQAFAGHPRALYGLSQLAIQLRDGEQAVDLAQALVRAEPDQPSYLLLLGDAYRAAGKVKEARESWQNAARRGNALARKRLK